ncbi:UbiH/UbiF/VisC/COQ6 family ubiquinone biosynthesis hydroxylase [Luminiphilus sp. nBUS_07]|uniref:UbiH/UbiF/VisC/COQ6 family ubiquinone biosynthesis hydroxylase n=1 Tax=Luminiphilus sp. nBUS_07 TaxID=3395314 RepID=UPI003EBBDA4E
MAAAESSDIVIVGAGIAGLSLALGLAQQGMKVTIIEAGSQPSAPPRVSDLAGWDARVSALTPSSTAWLAERGVWQEMERHRVGPYTDMAVWDGAGTGRIAFSAESLEVPLLGHIVENRVTVQALLKKIDEQNNIRVHWEDSLEAADFSQHDAVTMETHQGRHLTTALLVGADGAKSRTRDLAGFAVRTWSYHQHAIVATVRLTEEHKKTCYQAFLDTGPLALLPLSDSRLCSIVWSLDDHQWEPLQSLDDDAFMAQLNLALASNGLAVEAIGRRGVFPLRQCHAVDYVHQGVALVGDAAHSIHPLAGQGINLGLKDVAVLSEEVGRAWQQGVALGSERTLRRYQRRRKTDNLLMMSAMEAFKRGFGSTHPAIRVARNMGLSWTDAATPLKNWLARQALT